MELFFYQPAINGWLEMIFKTCISVTNCLPPIFVYTFHQKEAVCEIWRNNLQEAVDCFLGFFFFFLSFNFSDTKLIRCAEISYLVIGFLRQRYASMMLYNNYANIQPRKYNNDATLYFLKTPVGLFLVLNQARKIWQSRTVITWCLGWLWSRS